MISNGATLTVEPGVVVKFAGRNSQIRVDDGGALLAEGTAAEPVVFTSIYDDAAGGDTDGGGASEGSPGQWESLAFFGGSTGRLSHAVVRYGGYGYSTNDGTERALVNVHAGADVEVADSELAHSLYEGVRLWDDAALAMTRTEVHHTRSGLSAGPDAVVVVEGSVFRDNSGHGVSTSNPASQVTSTAFAGNGSYPVQISATSGLPFLDGNTASGNAKDCFYVSGQTSSAAALRADAGFPFCVPSITVQSGGALTVEPGVVVKFAGRNSQIRVDDGGALLAEGTAAEPVVFTSIYDDAAGGDTDGGGASEGSPGQWESLAFFGGSTGRLSHAVVRYGGYGYSTNDGTERALVNVHAGADVRGRRLRARPQPVRRGPALGRRRARHDADGGAPHTERALRRTRRRGRPSRAACSATTRATACVDLEPGVAGHQHRVRR